MEEEEKEEGSWRGERDERKEVERGRGWMSEIGRGKRRKLTWRGRVRVYGGGREGRNEGQRELSGGGDTEGIISKSNIERDKMLMTNPFLSSFVFAVEETEKEKCPSVEGQKRRKRKRGKEKLGEEEKEKMGEEETEKVGKEEKEKVGKEE